MRQPLYVFFGISLALFSSMVGWCQSSTPDYWQCNNRTTGEWSFGRVPSICDIDPFMDLYVASKQYDVVVFQDRNNRTEERERYMNQMNALIEETALYYASLRNPQASNEELSYWVRGIKAMAHQETFWSHYRIPTTKNYVQMMRGDRGHGHGIFQVDDRWHFSDIKSGKGANLMLNMFKGLDVFFSAWKDSIKAKCVSSATDYVSRVRSTWSQYNGGASNICRWAKGVQKDKDFFTRYQDQAWKKFITDYSIETTVNIECLAQGQENCPPRQTDDFVWKEDHLYILNSGYYCFHKNFQNHCVTQLDDVTCLALKFSPTSKEEQAMEVPDEATDDFPKIHHDRHQLCQSSVSNLYPVGTYIKIKKDINLRQTPGGNLVSTLKSGDILQVQDFMALNKEVQSRYYKIMTDQKSGYLYAGNATSFKDWAVTTTTRPKERYLTLEKETLFNNNLAPLSIRTADGHEIGEIGVGEEFEVFQTKVQGDNNSILYLVDQKGPGYVFAGQLLPDLKLLLRPQDKTVLLFTVKLHQDNPFEFLKSCPSLECDDTRYFVYGPQFSDRPIGIYQIKQDWYLARNHLGQEGWILKDKTVKQ